MGRELQKKKRRSGRAPVKMSNKPKNPLNPRGNSIIAKNWNKKETLAQNYRRLGLVSRLKAPTGGTEKKVDEASNEAMQKINNNRNTTPFGIDTVSKAIVSEARVERDPETGKITKVMHSSNPNPLNDPLNYLDDPETMAEEYDPTHQHTLHGTASVADAQGSTDVVRSLLEQSSGGEPKKKRHQSEREREWLGRLVGRHGDDYAAMARDGKLNPMQQTAGDIKRRVQKMNAA